MTTSRVRTSIVAEFQAGKSHGQGKIRNLGAQGMFLGTEAKLDTGDVVDLRFRMPSGEPMAVRGLIWWSTRDEPSRNHKLRGVGLRLIEDNESYEKAYDKLSTKPLSGLQ
jgi:hypothetical protein